VRERLKKRHEHLERDKHNKRRDTETGKKEERDKETEYEI
jgi:hypothetical protein